MLRLNSIGNNINLTGCEIPCARRRLFSTPFYLHWFLRSTSTQGSTATGSEGTCPTFATTLRGIMIPSTAFTRNTIAVHTSCCTVLFISTHFNVKKIHVKMKIHIISISTHRRVICVQSVPVRVRACVRACVSACVRVYSTRSACRIRLYSGLQLIGRLQRMSNV